MDFNLCSWCTGSPNVNEHQMILPGNDNVNPNGIVNNNIDGQHGNANGIVQPADQPGGDDDEHMNVDHHNIANNPAQPNAVAQPNAEDIRISINAALTNLKQIERFTQERDWDVAFGEWISYVATGGWACLDGENQGGPGLHPLDGHEWNKDPTNWVSIYRDRWGSLLGDSFHSETISEYEGGTHQNQSTVRR